MPRGRFTAGQVLLPWQTLITALSLLALVGLVLEAALPSGSQQVAIFQRIDLLFCAFFFADFVRRFVRAPDRVRYLVTWGWLDLVSSIPFFPIARWARIADVIRFIGVIREAPSAEAVGKAMVKNRKSVAMASAALLLFLSLVVGAILVLEFERHNADATIHTGLDALWWAVTTLTTVGYGDYVPVTTGGRAVGAVLMVLGISMFAAVAGYFASWLVEDTEEQQAETAHLHRIEHELKALRKLIEEKNSEEPPKE